MKVEFSLDESLARVATIGECHWVKAWFAAGRMVRRLPELRTSIYAALGNSDWDLAHRTAAALADGMIRPERFSATRAMRLVARGVFPAAYVAAHDWVAQSRTPAEGFARLVEAVRLRAINESGRLGHGFSIWAGYADLAESGLLEKAPNRARVATERLAEFIAQALPGYPIDEPDWAAPSFGEAGPRALPSVLDQALDHPGFFGHNLILLAHATRYRLRLTPLEWYRLLAQTESAARQSAAEPALTAPQARDAELAGSVPAGPFPDAPGLGRRAAILALALGRHLRRTPGNVHRITLGDAVVTLLEVATPSQQDRLIQVIDSI